MEIALPAHTFAHMVMLAMSQADDTDVNETLFRPTRQELGMSGPRASGRRRRLRARGWGWSGGLGAIDRSASQADGRGFESRRRWHGKPNKSGALPTSRAVMTDVRKSV
jgi:hypothetical protein